MNTPVLIIGIITLLLIWWNLSVSIKIINYLKNKGKEVSLFNNMIFVKGKIFKYLPLYRKVTIEKDGKVGSLYNTFYLSFILSIVFLGIGIALLT
jgi:hypothetical protein